MKLSIMEAALMGALASIQEKIDIAVTGGHEWRYRERITLYNEMDEPIGETIGDDETRLRFMPALNSEFDYSIRVSFWDLDGELDHFVLDVAVKDNRLNVRMNDDLDAIYQPIEDLGQVINVLARLDSLEEELAEDARKHREAQEEYQRKRSRFTVIDCTQAQEHHVSH